MRISVEVGYEALEFTNIDMAAFLCEHTIALALTFVAAYASAHCRQIAARVDYFHCVSEVAFGEFGNPVGDVIGNGAAFLTSGYLAVETALSFADSFGESVVFRDFFEKVVHCGVYSVYRIICGDKVNEILCRDAIIGRYSINRSAIA